MYIAVSTQRPVLSPLINQPRNAVGEIGAVVDIGRAEFPYVDVIATQFQHVG